MPKFQETSKFVPPLVAVFVLAAFLFLWQVLRGEDRAQVQAKIQSKAKNVKDEIQGRVHSEIKALVRMSKRWENEGRTPRQLWEADARLYVEHTLMYQAIEWVDADYRVRWIEPLEGNEKARDLDLSFEENRRAAMEKARKYRRLAVSHAVDLVQGGKGFLGFSPMFRGGEFDGFILGVFRIDHLLNAILDERVVRGVTVALFDEEQKIYQNGPSDAPIEREWTQETNVDLYGVRWRLHVWPTPELLKEEKSALPETVLALGALTACLMGFLARLTLRARQYGQEVTWINLELEKEIGERGRTEDLLREKQAFTRTILASLMDGIVVMDEAGTVMEFNPAAERMFGYPAAEVIGKNVKMLMPEPYRSEHDRYLKRYLQTGKSGIIGVGREVVGIRKDGRVFPLELGVAETCRGDRRSFIGTLCDITARKKAAEKSLRESEELLRSIIDNAAAAIYVKDIQGKFLLVNRQMEKLAGLTSEQIRGKTDHDLFPKESADQFTANDRMVLDTGLPLEREETLAHDDGLHTYISTKVPLRDSAGKIYGLCGLSTDITHRKLAEENLRKSNLFMSSLLDSPAETSIISTDMEGTVLYWNKGAEKMLGYKALEMMGHKHKVDILYPDDETRRTVREALSFIIGNKRGVSCEVRELTKSGETIWAKLTLSPKFDESGNVAGILGIGENVTQRKLAEENLRASEERSRLIVDTASDAFISIDEAGAVLEWNAQAEKTFGWPRQEAVGARMAELIIPKNLREAHENGLRRFLETGQSKVLNQRVELTAVHRDGREFPVELSISALQLKGKYVFNAFVHDIGQRKLMMAQLTHAQKMESIGQLSAGIAHEINTPMQYIGDNLRFLQDSFKDLLTALGEYGRLLENGKNGAVSGKLVESVEAAVSGTDLDYLAAEIPQAIRQSLEGVGRMTKIVRAMKEFSHPGDSEKKPSDINKMLETTVTVSRNEWKYVSSVEMDLDPGLPMVSCLADDMNQVFL
ncbi:MAG: PAS domain S-box protein, partial [Nitrospinae bacterium]|nr:PAS domain S-box protein [Nitrospinota bacterium]